MAVVVPAKDTKNYAKYVEVQGVATQVTATAPGPHQEAAKQRQIAVNAELVTTLMHSGQLSPLTILAACTYGT
jgi:hypothetical protein